MLWPQRMTNMAAPRASTAFAKTAGTTTSRKTSAAAAKNAAAKRAASSVAQPPSASTDASRAVAEMLHDLQINGEALSAQIARLAQRFL